MLVYIFSELKVRLRVSISLTLHGDVIALLNWGRVEQGKGCFLRRICLDMEQVKTPLDANPLLYLMLSRCIPDVVVLLSVKIHPFIKLSVNCHIDLT